MGTFQKFSLFFLRMVLGFFYFYAGITKVLNPDWSAAGYLKGAKTFSWFYQWLTTPDVLPIINFLNEWGLTLLGVSLILGVAVRLSSFLGIVLMALYYLPALQFPYLNSGRNLLIDDHVILIAALLVLYSFRAGRVWGLENWCINLPICSRFPKLRSLLG